MSQADGNHRKLGELITETVADLQILIRQQIDLTVAELRESAKRALVSSGLVLTAAGFLVVSALLLVIALGFFLASLGIPTWLAFVLDALIFITIAGVLLLIAYSNAKKVQLPRTAMANAEQSINEITAAVTRTETAN